ncbi:MAG: serine acetyltransferase [Bacteroidota bacterium]
MIQSKKDYLDYLAQDKVALGVKSHSLEQKIIGYISPNPIWTFQKRLRKLEYYSNCKNKGLLKIYVYYLRFLFKKTSVKLGFSIPINVFGPGLAIIHYGTIVVNIATKVGKNCRMHAGVNIGASGGSKKAPVIGNNVYIGPGAKIYGDIEIADNCAIGANAVVNKTFLESSKSIAGVPAKVIGDVDITSIITHI